MNDLAREYFTRIRKIRPSVFFFTKKDNEILKSLAKNKNIIISRPDKGRGVVVLNAKDYREKMTNILEDATRFRLIIESHCKVIFKLEDRINRFLSQLKSENMITETIYKQLRVTGSYFGSLYGLCKIHKMGFPMRPVLAAYNMASYGLGKFLVPLIVTATRNEHSINNSYDFAREITQLNSDGFMVSYDVFSLFTNVPLNETMEIILDRLFPHVDYIHCGFDRASFKKMLILSSTDCFFTFGEDVYQQIDGVAMWVPCGPSFANAFMVNLERQMMDRCPSEFKPSFYRRYVDDTFAIFKQRSHAQDYL